MYHTRRDRVRSPDERVPARSGRSASKHSQRRGVDPSPGRRSRHIASCPLFRAGVPDRGRRWEAPPGRPLRRSPEREHTGFSPPWSWLAPTWKQRRRRPTASKRSWTPQRVRHGMVSARLCSERCTVRVSGSQPSGMRASLSPSRLRNTCPWRSKKPSRRSIGLLQLAKYLGTTAK